MSGTTEAAAIYQFLSGFDIPAYASGSVPSDASLPYITYDLTVGGWLDGEQTVTVDVWYRTTSDALVNAKAREISEALGKGGRRVPIDGGALWLKQGSPKWLDAGEEDGVKHRRVNIDVEFDVFD